MKWVIAIALAVLLVVVCVVYFRYERPPVQRVAVTAVSKPAKPAKPFAARAGKPGPIDISGPLKDRALVSWVLPEYPEWAEEQGVTGTVRTKIWVTPAGVVKSFMEPQALSGDQRFEKIVEETLRQWQFVEKPNTFGDQWGVITVRFALLPKEHAQQQARLHGFSLGKMTASGAWECVRQWVGDAEKHLVYICKLKKVPVRD